MRSGGALFRHLVGPVLGALIASAPLSAEPSLTRILDSGTPPITLHRPDVPVYPQNFAVAEGPRGLIWLGNSDGLLAFDGEEWRLWRLPNRDLVRSLAVTESGRIYVGGYNAFGYFEPDVSGTMQYVGLEALFSDALGEREFADVWDVLVTPECVYFKSLHDLFCWRPEDGATQFWSHEGRFGAVARVGNETWLQFRGEGLRRRVADDWEKLPASASLGNLMFQLLPLVDGDLLGVGLDEQAWRIDRQGRPTAQPMPESLPAPSQLQHGIVRADGSLVFVAADGALFSLAADLSSARRIPLNGDYLAGVAESRGGGLLVAADSGLLHVRWPSRWSLLGSEHGLFGSLHDAFEWNDTLILLGSGRVQAVQFGKDGTLRVQTPDWGEQGMHAVLPLGPARALLGGLRRLSLLDSGQQRELSTEDIYPSLLQRSSHRPQRILVGTEFGVRSVDLSTSPSSLSAAAAPALAVGVNSIAELDDGSLWVGSNRHGLWRYRWQEQDAAWHGERIDQALGIQTGPIASLSVDRLADGQLLASSTSGFWRGTPQAMSRVDLDGLEGLRDPEEYLLPVLFEGELRWAFSHYRVFERHADGWSEQSAGGLRRGALLAGRALDRDRLLLVSDKAVLVHSQAEQGGQIRVPQVRLREVWYEDAAAERHGLPLSPREPPVLTHGDSALHFSFAAVDLDQPESVRYRGQLVGEETAYSPWSRANGYTYFNLPAGTYRMQIEARDGSGRISAMTPYTLVVVPQWFETLWFRLALGSLTVLLIGMVVRALSRRRQARVHRQTQQLELQVSQRTAELAEANRRLQTMADLDGLTGLANRRRLDEYLPLAWEQCATRGRPLSVLLVDVDHFKRFNDRHGHLAGDELIRAVAALLRRSLRRSEDLAVRFGGEEFLVALPGAGLELARELAERLRGEIEASLGGITASIGVASEVPKSQGDVNTLIERADAALYRAKEAGRNRVCVDQAEPGAGGAPAVGP